MPKKKRKVDIATDTGRSDHIGQDHFSLSSKESGNATKSDFSSSKKEFVDTWFVIWYWKNPYGNYVEIVDLFSTEEKAIERADKLVETGTAAQLVAVAKRIK